MKMMINTALMLALSIAPGYAEDAIKRDSIDWNAPIEPSRDTSTNEDKKKVVTAVGLVLILGAAAVAVATGGSRGD